MIPLVTVCMVAYNAEKWISQAILSVLNQTYKNFVLLIVDDGSTDITKKIIMSYVEHTTLGDRIRYIYQEHKNFAVGLNRAITEAESKYLLNVDSDDYIASDYLEKMVECAEKHPDIDYFYPCYFVETHELGAILRTWPYRDWSDNRKIKEVIQEKKRSPIPRPGSLIRRSLFDRVGLYEEVDTCEDFLFLCKNVFDIKFKKVDTATEYFYRRVKTGNSMGKREIREEIHNQGLAYL